MSSGLGGVLLRDKIADPFIGKPGEPKRHSVVAGASATGEGETKNPAFNIKFRQVANEGNRFWRPVKSPHSAHSPSLNTTERFDSGECGREHCKRLNGLHFVKPVPFLPSAPALRRTVVAA